MNSELEGQVTFLVEIDKLKGISRRSPLIDGSRLENSAEHSWHVAMCATILASYAAEEVDLARVLRMLLVHDIVEIDAGDTFAYDTVGRLDQHEREARASERLFGLLATAQGEQLAALWAEFEAAQTPDAQFANAVDRFMPILHNYHNEGHAWRRNGVTRAQVLQRVASIETGIPAVWPYIAALLDDAVRRGYLAP